MTTWQPIETAPEDLLILIATTGDWISAAWKVVDEDTGDEQWFWFGGGRALHRNHVPTHWMPLPELPK